MANTGYDGTVGTVHNYCEDSEAASAPLQLRDLSYIDHSLDHFTYSNQTSNYHDQDHPQSIPSTSEENQSFDSIAWQATLNYPNMAPAIANDRHISETPLENPAVEASSSHFTTENGPQGFLRCTYPSCTAKEEAKTFTGKGAKSALKRHMDGHTKPFMCTEVRCPRRTRGFSRRDNYNNHLKTHQKKKHRRSTASSHSSPLGVLGGRTSAVRRGLQRMTPHQRGRVLDVLLTCLELEIEVDEDEEDDAGSDDDEETEEDGAE